MERRRLLQVLSLAWLSSFIHTALGAEPKEIVAAFNQSVVLNFPERSDVNEVVWKMLSDLVGKVRNNTVTYTGKCGCVVHENGSVTLHSWQTFEERTYTYELYNKAGENLNGGKIRVIVIELMDSPVISYNCSETRVRVQCAVSSKNVSELAVSWDGGQKSKDVKGAFLETNITHHNKPRRVTCEAKNQLGEEKTSKKIDCTNPWSLEMILGVAGGGVAFIIFLILLIFCLTQRCCKRDRRGDVEVSYMQPGHTVQQRQLPQPPSQHNTQNLAQSLVNPAEHNPGQRNQTAQRKAPPEPPTQDNRVAPSKNKGISELTDTGSQPRNKHSQRPSLPSNHPAEQPPHPQPRNQSKPHRQQRRKQ
uniref:T-cell surface antigen CD2 n=1 Tax=Leptobrachium leishanense TaxID=445787 RepID=A0A8C5LNK6_9ANUR